MMVKVDGAEAQVPGNHHVVKEVRTNHDLLVPLEPPLVLIVIEYAEEQRKLESEAEVFDGEEPVSDRTERLIDDLKCYN